MAFSLRRHWVVSAFLLRQWSSSLRPLHACAVTMVRSRHVVEDRITLFVRPLGVTTSMERLQ